MILTQAQAQAVYSAICTLNKVGAEFDRVELPDRLSIVRHYKSESLEVQKGGRCAEEYDNPAGFAAAYSLRPKQ